MKTVLRDVDATSTPTTSQGRGPSWSFYLLASIVVSFIAGSAAPTPLYSIYQDQWSFSPITTTVVFGVYAIAVLVSLLVAGRLSDHIGRRPVLLVAVAVQAVTMLIFTTAEGVPQLLAGRVVQGLSTGAALAAVGAGMLDLDKARGAIANSIVPMAGTAMGALGSGLLAQFLPQPTHLVYLVLFVVFLVQGAGVLLMRETSSPIPGAIASLRPQLGVPPAARGPLALATPVLVASWSLPGFYGSIGPALLERMVVSRSLLLGGLGLFVLATSAAVTVLLSQRRSARGVLGFGTATLFVGAASSLVGVSTESASLLFVAMVVAGMGFGAAFQGAVRLIVPLAAPHERAGLLSVIYLIAYLAMGLPAVIAGILVVDGGGVMATAEEYAGAVMVLAAIAALGIVRPQRPQQQVPRQVQPACTCEGMG